MLTLLSVNLAKDLVSNVSTNFHSVVVVTAPVARSEIFLKRFWNAPEPHETPFPHQHVIVSRSLARKAPERDELESFSHRLAAAPTANNDRICDLRFKKLGPIWVQNQQFMGSFSGTDSHKSNGIISNLAEACGSRTHHSTREGPNRRL